MNKPDRAPPRAYPDLHDHIVALEKAGQLIRVTRPINKDTEMHPLVRWQFRGEIPQDQRKAFLFTNVVDSHGKRYDIPVMSASSRPIAKSIASGLVAISTRSTRHGRVRPPRPFRRAW